MKLDCSCSIFSESNSLLLPPPRSGLLLHDPPVPLPHHLPVLLLLHGRVALPLAHPVPGLAGGPDAAQPLPNHGGVLLKKATMRREREKGGAVTEMQEQDKLPSFPAREDPPGRQREGEEESFQSWGVSLCSFRLSGNRAPLKHQEKRKKKTSSSSSSSSFYQSVQPFNWHRECDPPPPPPINQDS